MLKESLASFPFREVGGALRAFFRSLVSWQDTGGFPNLKQPFAIASDSNNHRLYIVSNGTTR